MLWLVACTSAPHHPATGISSSTPNGSETSGNHGGDLPTILECGGRIRILSGAEIGSGAGTGSPILDLSGAGLDWGWPWAQGLGDLDGDGRSEIAIGSSGGDGTVRLLRSGDLAGPVDVQALPEMGTVSPNGGGVWPLGDVTGDGLRDFVFYAREGMGIYSGADPLGDPVGQIASTGDLFGTTPIDPGDLDGDGIADLAIGRIHYGDPDSFDEAVFLGPIHGSPDLAAPDAVVPIVLFPAGDVDGDGLADAYQLNSGKNGSVELFGGAGVLAGEPPEDAMWTLHGDDLSVAPLGDVDGDGGVDLAVSGDGNGLYTSASILAGAQVADHAVPVCSGCTAFAHADLDGDGASELLFLSSTSIVVYDWAAIEAGAPRTTGPFDDLATPLDLGLVSIGDIDGDGADDLLLSERYGGCYSYNELRVRGQ